SRPATRASPSNLQAAWICGTQPSGQRSRPSFSQNGSVGGAPYLPPMTSLTDRQHRILTFERQWWKHLDARTATVRELFDCSPTQYRRELDEIIDRPDALA